jgi:uncharacterized protein involved in outer membrane biogenesis
MKRKIIFGVLTGFVVVLILAIVVVGFFLGDVVKAGMETVGPKVTQTPLTVGSVKISALTGSVSLNDFNLGNPGEYTAKAPNAISAGKTAVSVAPMSLLSDKIVVKEIEVRNAEITFVGNPFGANNLKKIMDNVNAFTGGSAAKPAETNAPVPPAEKQPGKKLEVDKILITGAKVHFNGATLPLPDIHLENLGTGPDGITPAALVKDMLNEINVATLKVVVEAAGKLGQNATDAVKETGKSLGGDASKIGKSLGDMFKK